MRRVVAGRAGMVAAFVLGLVIATAATAGAARLITGKQIKDGSIGSRDLAKAVRTQIGKPGPAGPVGATGAPGAPGAAGPQGARGPSEAYRVTGPSPVNLTAGSSVEVASITVPAGAYTVSATGFIYSDGTPPVGQTDQFSCTVYDAADTALGTMPSQTTLDGPMQFTVIGAGDAVAGKLRLACLQIAVTGADSGLTEISGTLVATRVGTVIRP